MLCKYKVFTSPLCIHPYHWHQILTDEICAACSDNTVLYPLEPIGEVAIPMRSPCAHLGSQRKCCESLFICRKLKQDCVKTSAENFTALLCCETCEHFEALGPS